MRNQYVVMLNNYMQVVNSNMISIRRVYMTQQVKWMKNMSLGGWMVMDLSGDDFSGKFCNAGKYPLVSRLNNALNDGVIATT